MDAMVILGLVILGVLAIVLIAAIVWLAKTYTVEEKGTPWRKTHPRKWKQRR